MSEPMQLDSVFLNGRVVSLSRFRTSYQIPHLRIYGLVEEILITSLWQLEKYVKIRSEEWLLAEDYFKHGGLSFMAVPQ